MSKLEYTLSIIKPDAVKSNFIGNIISKCELANFIILAIKMLKLNLEQAEALYLKHSNKSFFNSLVKFMSSGPVVLMVLCKENAVDDYRYLIGSTDPVKARKNSIRALYGKNIEKNAVHGSDSHDTAKVEINYFFSDLEVLKYYCKTTIVHG